MGKVPEGGDGKAIKRSYAPQAFDVSDVFARIYWRESRSWGSPSVLESSGRSLFLRASKDKGWFPDVSEPVASPGIDEMLPGAKTAGDAAAALFLG